MIVLKNVTIFVDERQLTRMIDVISMTIGNVSFSIEHRYDGLYGFMARHKDTGEPFNTEPIIVKGLENLFRRLNEYRGL